MTIREQLLQEIEQVSDVFLGQLLEYILFLKEQHPEEEITEEERASIIASESAYQAGDYLTLEEYEAGQP